MSLIWDRLASLQNEMSAAIDLTNGSRRTKEPGMNRFNNDKWTNRTWTATGIRRAHLDVVDARADKGLWMMHVCIMPELTSDGPIFGFDVIAGRNKITGAFLDYSPGTNADHEMMQVFAKMVEDLKWKRERELPDWAKAIFSGHMVAAGNITDEMELEQIITATKHALWYYIDNIRYTTNRSDELMVAKVQNHYARHQKMNPHTPKVMKSLGLPEEDVDLFTSKCLFPEIDTTELEKRYA